MGKAATPSKFADNQAGATAKFMRVPPRKARLVMDAVRGKYVSDALAILKFVPNFAARAIEDVIMSAVANAENGRPYSEETDKPLPPLIVENLRLVRAFVDEGPRIKRLQPRANGQAAEPKAAEAEEAKAETAESEPAAPDTTTAGEEEAAPKEEPKEK